MSDTSKTGLTRRQLLTHLVGGGCGFSLCLTRFDAMAGGVVRAADGRWLAPEIARIVNRKTLVVAMLNADMPPFFYQSNGNLIGLEVDMARAMAKELKVEVRFDRQAKTFNDVVDVVARGDADLGISKLSRTLARSQVIRFTTPYLRLNHALVVNRDQFARLAKDKQLGTVIRNFTGKLGVIAKSSFEDYASTNFPKAELRKYSDWSSLVDAVRKGEVVAAYRDEFEAKRLLQVDKKSALTLRTVTLTDLEDTLGIAVGHESPTLLAFVDQYLGQRTDRLTIDRVLKAVATTPMN